MADTEVDAHVDDDVDVHVAAGDGVDAHVGVDAIADDDIKAYESLYLSHANRVVYNFNLRFSSWIA